MSEQVRIVGLEDACEKLRTLPEKLAKRGLRKALAAGAKPLREAMAQKVQKGWHIWQNGNGEGKGRSRDFGFISTHIGVQMKISADEMKGVARVGPVKKGFWAQFLEFGTRKMKAYPFARPSYDSQKENMVQRFVESLRETLQEVIGKR